MIYWGIYYYIYVILMVVDNFMNLKIQSYMKQDSNKAKLAKIMYFYILNGMFMSL